MRSYAVDLSPITDLIHEYAVQFQVVGGVILLIAIIFVAIKLAAKSVGSSQNGMRETMGALFGIVIAAFLLGGVFLIGPLLIGAGGG